MIDIQELQNHKAVKAYCQHGFLPTKENPTQIIGQCPFCQKQNHFYVNKETKKWDCKSCGKEGGFKGFLEQINLQCQENFTDKVAYKLHKLKNIKISTLRTFNIGFNQLTGNYIVPIYDITGSKLHDLRYYSHSRMIGTFTCQAVLWNWEKIEDCEGKIWICEGEWDAMIMYEILQSIERYEDTVLSAPGALTFKGEWQILFKNRDVNVLYDNDKKGKDGGIKVFNVLKSVVNSLRFINWGSGTPEHFDIRDLYLKCTKNGKKTFNKIEKMLSDLPPDVDVEGILRTGKVVKKLDKYDGEGLHHEKVYSIYKKWLHLPDTDVIDVLFGSVIANRLEGDPLWVFLVAPPGFTKSELLMSISAAKNVYTIDAFTVAGMVSGYTAGGVDQSLILQLDGQVLVMKDFTTILTSNENAKREIFGMLRSIYDGVFKKRFGNIERNYISKFGIIAGVTPAVGRLMRGEAGLGERFLKFELKLPVDLDEHLLYLQKAIDNSERENQMRAELKKAGTDCLNFEFNPNIKMPPKIKEKLMYLSIVISTLRSTIERDKYTHEILQLPYTEAGTRPVKELKKLLRGVSMFKRKTEISEVEYNLLCKVTQGNIPPEINLVLSQVYQRDRKKEQLFSLNELMKITGLPKTICKIAADDLKLLKILNVNLANYELRSEYFLNEKFKNIIDKSGIYNIRKKIKKERL